MKSRGIVRSGRGGRLRVYSASRLGEKDGGNIYKLSSSEIEEFEYVQPNAKDLNKNDMQ